MLSQRVRLSCGISYFRVLQSSSCPPLWPAQSSLLISRVSRLGYCWSSVGRRNTISTIYHDSSTRDSVIIQQLPYQCECQNKNLSWSSVILANKMRDYWQTGNKARSANKGEWFVWILIFSSNLDIRPEQSKSLTMARCPIERGLQSSSVSILPPIHFSQTGSSPLWQKTRGFSSYCLEQSKIPVNVTLWRRVEDENNGVCICYDLCWRSSLSARWWWWVLEKWPGFKWVLQWNIWDKLWL